MPRHLRFDPHRYNEENYPNYLRFRLEAEGPTGERYPQTSNRAELRAVIAALRFRFWFDEGFNKVVIATDSAYVVEGITKWISTWLRNNWRTSVGADVKNKDLWQLLLWEMERYDVRNTKIQFWRIPRELNSEADYHAKEGAMEEPSIKFGDHRAMSHDWVQFYRVNPTSAKRKMPADFY